jgi:stage III sporulation protein AB
VILWVKAIGSVLLVAAFSLAGYAVADNYSRRPKELRDLLTALQMLETEIMYGAVPLPDALYHIAQFSKGSVRDLFAGVRATLLSGQGRTAGEAWQISLETIFPASSLSDTDQAILAGFGGSLGISDREDQVKHINLAREQLKREEAIATEESLRCVRLWKSLGLLAGLAVCLAVI